MNQKNFKKALAASIVKSSNPVAVDLGCKHLRSLVTEKGGDAMHTQLSEIGQLLQQVRKDLLGAKSFLYKWRRLQAISLFAAFAFAGISITVALIALLC